MAVLEITCFIYNKMNILNNILKYVLNNFHNRRILIENGIDTRRLVIAKLDSIFEKSLVEILDIKKINPEIGKTSSLIKNLDEYQYIFGNLIPEMDDKNRFKMDMQKSRVYIFYAMTVIINYFKKNQFEKIDAWNTNVNNLEKISEFYVDYRNNDLDKKINFDDISNYLDIDDDFINKTIEQYYK